jgi:type II secretory pathway pseudopilin PulG
MALSLVLQHLERGSRDAEAQGVPRVTRSGGTIIELMVALVVTGLLAALLVPALLQVRETSRMTACSLRLGQIGQATHSYAAQHADRLPNGASWRVQLLPWLGEINGFRQIQAAAEGLPMPEAVVARERAAAALPVIDVYTCPSAGGPEIQNGWVSSYSGCSAGVPWRPEDPPVHVRASADGLFPIHSDQGKALKRRLAEAVDGLSHTAMYSEHLPWLGGAPRRLRVAWDLPQVYPDEPPAVWLEACERLPAEPEPLGYRWVPSLGLLWHIGGYGYSVYNHALPPNRPSCRLQFLGLRGSIFTAASQHVGGVHLLYGDGHHEFISETITPAERKLRCDLDTGGDLV